MNFEEFWTLVENHGSVAYFHKNECENLWRGLTPEQQQAVYNAIQRKLDSGLFVHYNPTKAVRDNLPKAPQIQILSADPLPNVATNPKHACISWTNPNEKRPSPKKNVHDNQPSASGHNALPNSWPTTTN